MEKITAINFTLTTRLCFSLLLMLSGGPLFSQTGPGGVGSTNGSSDLELWLDANQITGIYDDNNVTTWSDLSGNGNDATQSNSSSKPNLKVAEVNGFPAVSFNGNSESMDGNVGTLNAPATLVSVVYFENLSQPSNDNDYVLSVGSTNDNGENANLARRRGDDTGNEDKFYSFDGDTNRFGPTLTGQQWMILTQTHSSSSPFHAFYLDGTSETIDDYNVALNSDGAYRIGNFYSAATGEFRFNGQMAETIIFSKVLTTAELNLLHSYLGAKYDISVGGDQYTGDDSGNGSQDRDVAGVGTESDGSVSEATAGGFTLRQVSNFGNGDYVIFGHAVKTNSVNTGDASNAGGTLEARWDRAWWLDITDGGSAITVDIEFDFEAVDLGGIPDGTASNYQLLHRTSGSGNWSSITATASISGDRVIFSGAAITADGYYTLGSIDTTNSPLGTSRNSLGSDGPGGVGARDGSTDLVLWLNPEEVNGNTDDPIVRLEDLSGSDHDATQTGILNIPTLQNDVVNGNSILRFDGFGDFMEGSLGSFSAPATIVVAGYFATLNQGNNDNDYLISIGPGTTLNQHTSIARRYNNTPADADKYYAWDGSNTRFGPVLTGQQWNIYTQTQNTSAQRHNFYLDGSLQTVTDFTGSFSSNGSYNIGRWTGGSNPLAGDIGDVIIFDRLLNSAEINIINSYLGAKYDLSMTDDQYTGDDAARGHHDLEVAGIGTESDGSNTSASSAGVLIEQNSNFGNGDYLIFGHRTETNALNTLDLGGGSGQLDSRWERSWWIDVTDGGAAITVDVTFDYSEAGIDLFPGDPASNYKLLYRSDTTGDWTVVASGSSISGDQVHFTAASLVADGQITLGTFDELSSPLPIELLYFKAAAQPAPQGGELVTTRWSTITEINNDYFTVERSKDGEHFEEVGRIDGAGNSLKPLEYEWEDPAPFSGLSYYRLKQTDTDGSYTYSNLEAVTISQEPIRVKVLPNPATEWFTLRTTGVESQLDIILRNPLGQEIRNWSFNPTAAPRISVDGLSAGSYMLEIHSPAGVQFEKLVVRHP